MKLLNKTADKFIFELAVEEKELLLEVLKLYPVLDPAHQCITRSIRDKKIEQSEKLLKEAIVEQQKRNREMMKELFDNGLALKQQDYYCKLELKPEQLEGLLQVLNDIRVGTWRNLGSPDYEQLDQMRVKKTDVVSLVVMDICEYFEYHLLEVIG